MNSNYFNQDNYRMKFSYGPMPTCSLFLEPLTGHSFQTVLVFFALFRLSSFLGNDLAYPSDFSTQWYSLSVCCFLFHLSGLLLLPQVWVEPWRVSVCALVLQGLPHTWVGAAVTQVAEVVLLARGRSAVAGVTGSKMLTWTLSSQRRWRCIWTLQAPPLPEGGQPGNETPPSVVMSSQTPLHTNATGWSDLLPAYVCEGGGGECLQGQGSERGMDGLMWDRCADGQTFGCRAVPKNPGWKWKQGLKVSVQSVQMLNEFCSLSPFPTLLPQITDLQSEHLMSVCAGDWGVWPTSHNSLDIAALERRQRRKPPTHSGMQTVLIGVNMHCAAWQVKATWSLTHSCPSLP